MPSTIPEQYRAVDPFASYNSNTVNQLSEIRSRAENVLDIPCGLDVIADATSNTSVVVKPGYVFKDDVMIYVSEEHTVDFTDLDDSYITTPQISDLVAGYYYIVLEYTFIKSRPAPQARIKIVVPDQRNYYDYGNSSTSLVFLKAVDNAGSPTMAVNSLSDYDPSLGYTDNKREYAKRYSGAETNFDPSVHVECDQGRFVYDVTNDEFWFGYEDRWDRLNTSGSSYSIDTDNLTIGDLAYVNASGEAAAAIVTSLDTAAEMVVVEVGVAVDYTGQARLNGYVEDVNVEAANSPSTGDLLYLSKTEAGHVTNTITTPYNQVVGRAVSDATAPGGKVNILFFGRAVLETGTASRLTAILPSGGSWLGAGPYYQDIDITTLGLSDQEVVVSCRDVGLTPTAVINPGDVDLSGANTVRIWMPTQHASNLVVTVIG